MNAAFPLFSPSPLFAVFSDHRYRITLRPVVYTSYIPAVQDTLHVIHAA